MAANNPGRMGETKFHRASPYDDTALHPKMIVEYKAPTIAITRQVFEQIGRYNLVLGVEYLTVSNGLSHFCCKVDNESHKFSFLKEIPPYSML